MGTSKATITFGESRAEIYNMFDYSTSSSRNVMKANDGLTDDGILVIYKLHVSRQRYRGSFGKL